MEDCQKTLELGTPVDNLAVVEKIHRNGSLKTVCMNAGGTSKPAIRIFISSNNQTSIRDYRGNH
jgi:hypothetical protein